MSAKKNWTREEIATLFTMRSQGLPASTIAKKLKRTPHAVYIKVSTFDRMDICRLKARESYAAKRQKVRSYSNAISEHNEISCRPPEEVLRERNFRLSAPYRDLTALLLGDPRIGYSALEPKLKGKQCQHESEQGTVSVQQSDALTR